MNTTNNLIKQVSFNGGQITAIKDDNNETWTPIKPICEMLDILAHGQMTKISEAYLDGEEWATTQEICAVGADGKQREMTCIKVKNIPMWLFGIKINKVKEEARPALRILKNEIADIVARAFAPAESPLSEARMMLSMFEKMIVEQEKQAAKVHLLEQKIIEVESEPRIIQNIVRKPIRKLDVEIIRKNFSASLRREMSRQRMDHHEMNSELRYRYGHRDNWGVEQFRSAIIYLKSEYKMNLNDVESIMNRDELQ